MILFLTRLIDTKFWYLLSGIFLFRFAYILICGLDLVGDEAYYWDWSRRPDWCYYSKPPMIAWIIGATTFLFGDHTAVVRFPAAIIGCGFLWIYFKTAEAFFSRQVASISLLLILATPANAISNLIMTIDPPLYFFWMVSLYFMHQALFQAHTSSWLVAGIFAALAFLSKPTAIALPCLLGVFLLTHAKFRTKLRREYFYFLFPIALSLVPIILWNEQHDWIMLQHNQGHFAQDPSFSLSRRFSQFAGFLGLQILLFSPIIFILLICTVILGTVGYFRFDSKIRFLLLMGPIPLLGILGLSLMQKVQGNWPIPFYFTTLILLSDQFVRGKWARWLKPALLTGYGMVFLAYTLPFVISGLGLSNSNLDPTYRLRQWHTLAQDVDEIRRQLFKNPEETFIWVDAHRYLVSELAFYLPDHPRVFRFSPNKKIESQYELWPGPDIHTGKDALILSSKPMDLVAQRFHGAFQEIVAVGTISALKGSRRERRYFVYWGKQLNNGFNGAS